MFILGNMDPQTLAALLPCEARSRRVRTSFTDSSSRQRQTGPLHTLHQRRKAGRRTAGNEGAGRHTEHGVVSRTALFASICEPGRDRRA